MAEKDEKRREKRRRRSSGRSRAGTFGTILIVYGIIVFTSAWWVPQGNEDTAAYIFGFIIVLIGIAAPAVLASRD